MVQSRELSGVTLTLLESTMTIKFVSPEFAGDGDHKLAAIRTRGEVKDVEDVRLGLKKRSGMCASSPCSPARRLRRAPAWEPSNGERSGPEGSFQTAGAG